MSRALQSFTSSDAEDVIPKRRCRHRLAETAAHSDDEAELELDVEPRARTEARLDFLRRLHLPGRTNDRRPADDDGAGAPVVADRQVPPVGEEWLGVGAEQPPEVRRVLERRVEVDVVGDLEGKVRRRALEWHELGARGDELVDPRDGVLPRRAPEREERVERRSPRRPSRDRPQRDRGSRRRRETRRAARLRRPRTRRSRLRPSRRQHPERLELLDRLEEAAAPDRVEELLAHAGELLARRRAIAPGKGGSVEPERIASVSASAASSSPSNTAAARRLRKPCSPFPRTAWWRPAVALNTSPRSRHARTKRASSASLGTSAPPQRTFARSPSSARRSRRSSSPSSIGVST